MVMKMRIIYKISKEEADKISEVRKTIKDKQTDKRLYAVELRGRGKKNKEIAEKLDTSAKVVSRWVSAYKRGGIEALFNNRKGGNNRNLSFAEEAGILAKFAQRAEKGQIVAVSEIREAYEEAVGHKTAFTHIYAILKRHNWTKKMPRSRHPKKASEEAVEASKKLNLS